jgi:predicted secreted protein
MKRTLLSILTIAGFASLSVGQIEMSVGSSGDISGTQIDYTSAGAEVAVDIHVQNTSGSTMSLTIERERINETTGWTDYLCWGHESDPFGGVCYPVESANPWTTGTPVSIPADEGGSIAVHISPVGDNGCTVYRYKVMDGANELAYLDISVCKSASVEEIEPLSITVAPNPAKTYVKIKTNGVEGATVKMVDVLGNVVLKETVMGTSKTINTTDFRNGIYFVTVEAEGSKPITRKLIIKQ